MFLSRFWPLAGCALSMAITASAGPALAQDSFVQAGDIVIRARGIVVEPDEGADIDPIGGSVDIETAVMPELDFSYFFTDRLAVELIAAVTPHDVTATGTALGDVPLGELLLLPPTLTAQYHLPVTKRFKPYVGAGINVTFFIDEDAAGGAVTSIDADTSVGAALQAGFDYQISGPWMVNLDVKRLFLDTDVSINGGGITADVDINPWIFGFGVGYRF
ncbi:outer membrane protein [Rhodothalassium salexigens DSM 2132]|uniref:Outer membrane protein n=1 Tax=Rhodothalassium salexigens DSM 2132 TaxID=1188247 RepID=A0A4R2PRI0_RHOSA|nr:OmpW family outer membrane protein [Rhodothalassium salexigens]MBB4210183.1 outer membrane protein [Rhodothalassium salexigens DSM 2132]MBK1638553.1 hypothetical protein [Rhodothalassium salexigens DSM 2132]TCP38347.1 outer membrane protein [Rhodothalassium salexigens DSM 2132]